MVAIRQFGFLSIFVMEKKYRSGLVDVESIARIGA
jgi:hypothetical protein